MIHEPTTPTTTSPHPQATSAIRKTQFDTLLNNLWAFKDKLKHLRGQLMDHNHTEIILEREEVEDLLRGCGCLATQLSLKSQRILYLLGRNQSNDQSDLVQKLLLPCDLYSKSKQLIHEMRTEFKCQSESNLFDTSELPFIQDYEFFKKEGDQQWEQFQNTCKSITNQFRSLKQKTNSEQSLLISQFPVEKPSFQQQQSINFKQSDFYLSEFNQLQQKLQIVQENNTQLNEKLKVSQSIQQDLHSQVKDLNNIINNQSTQLQQSITKITQLTQQLHQSQQLNRVLLSQKASLLEQNQKLSHRIQEYKHQCRQLNKKWTQLTAMIRRTEQDNQCYHKQVIMQQQQIIQWQKSYRQLQQQLATTAEQLAHVTNQHYQQLQQLKSQLLQYRNLDPAMSKLKSQKCALEAYILEKQTQIQKLLKLNEQYLVQTQSLKQQRQSYQQELKEMYEGQLHNLRKTIIGNHKQLEEGCKHTSQLQQITLIQENIIRGQCLELLKLRQYTVEIEEELQVCDEQLKEWSRKYYQALRAKKQLEKYSNKLNRQIVLFGV